MPYEPLDLGRIIQTAEAIKGARQQSTTEQLRQQYLGIQMKNAQAQGVAQQQDQQLQMDAATAKRNYFTADAILKSQDPRTTAEALLPDGFVQKWNETHQVPWDQFASDPNQIKALAQTMRAKAGAAAGISEPARLETIGDLNKPEAGIYQRNTETNAIQQVTAPQKIDPTERARLDETIRHNRATEAASSDPSSQYDPETLHTAAMVVASDPARMRDYASFGKAGQAARVAINKQITQLKKDTGMSDSDFIQTRARAKAQAGNLAQLTKQQGQIQAAEDLARANGQRVLDLIGLVDDTGIPLIEGITRSAKAKAGNVDAAELKSVMSTFQTEVARLLASGPSMNGVISDSARHEVQAMAPENMSAAQAKRVINRLFTEMDIRQHAIQDQIGQAAGGSVVIPGPTTAPQPAAPPQVIHHPSGATIEIIQ